MMDLYKALGIDYPGSSAQEIKVEIEKSITYLKEDCRAVLLDSNRKAVYDRSYRTAKLIGKLRAKLLLADYQSWGREFGDFTPDISPKKDNNDNVGTSSGYNHVPGKKTSMNWPKLKATITSIVLIVPAVAFLNHFENRESTRPGTNTSDVYNTFNNSSGTGSSDYNAPNRESLTADTVSVTPKTPYSKYYVTASALNMRSGPSPQHPVVQVLPQYETVMAAETSSSGWLVVNVGNFEGYVSSSYMAAGDGKTAMIVDDLREVAYCRDNAGTAPRSGEVFSIRGSGTNELKVKAPSGSDVIVRLKNRQGDTVLDAFVASGRTQTFGNIPDGQFQFQYATGNDYSRACGTFIRNMSVNRDPDYTPYTTTSSYSTIMTYELVNTFDGNFSPSRMNVDDF